MTGPINTGPIPTDTRQGKKPDSTGYRINRPIPTGTERLIRPAFDRPFFTEPVFDRPVSDLLTRFYSPISTQGSVYAQLLNLQQEKTQLVS